VVYYKNIAGLAPPKNVSTLGYDEQPYTDSALTNLFNDKFVTVEKPFPPLAWTPLSVDNVSSNFLISVDDTSIPKKP
jgi:hypothetical protein